MKHSPLCTPRACNQMMRESITMEIERLRAEIKLLERRRKGYLGSRHAGETS